MGAEAYKLATTTTAHECQPGRHPAPVSPRETIPPSPAAHNRLGGMMWAMWPRILSDGETPIELIESAGRFPSRLAVVDATLFTRSEWKERHCSSSYPQTL